jgi:hypothetical protein
VRLAACVDVDLAGEPVREVLVATPFETVAAEPGDGAGAARLRERRSSSCRS